MKCSQPKQQQRLGAFSVRGCCCARRVMQHCVRVVQELSFQCVIAYFTAILLFCICQSCVRVYEAKVPTGIICDKMTIIAFWIGEVYVGKDQKVDRHL